MLVCLQIEESSFGLFFVNCYLHVFAYSWSFYFNYACLIDYKSWLIWMLFCSILRLLFNTVRKAISFLSFTLPKPDSLNLGAGIWHCFHENVKLPWVCPPWGQRLEDLEPESNSWTSDLSCLIWTDKWPIAVRYRSSVIQILGKSDQTCDNWEIKAIFYP